MAEKAGVGIEFEGPQDFAVYEGFRLKFSTLALVAAWRLSTSCSPVLCRSTSRHAPHQRGSPDGCGAPVLREAWYAVASQWFVASCRVSF